MAATLRFLQIFSLCSCVGSIIFISFLVTQGAFSVLPNNDLAGALVGYTLTKLHMIGIVAGVIYLVSTAANERSIGALAHPAALLVFVMIVCTMISQYGVIARNGCTEASNGLNRGDRAAEPLRRRLSIASTSAILV